MPRGIAEEGKVPKLERLLNGLHQFPRNFLENLKTNLLNGIHYSSADPCLFIYETEICSVYVDDTLLYSPTPTEI